MSRAPTGRASPRDAEEEAGSPPAPPAPGRYRVLVAPEEAGERLDRLLARRFPTLSRSRLKALIEEGAVIREEAPSRVGPSREAPTGGVTIDEPSTRVKPGQIFAILLPEARDARPEGQDIALAVVYEDEDLIVVDKPPGLVVHPAPGNPDRTLVNALIAHCGPGLSGVGGERRPGIVHRLDKDTSGLLVAAKNDAALQGLAEQFAARSLERSYEALVWGELLPPAGEIAGNIGRSPRNRKKMALLARGGKPAVTRYRTLARYADGLVSRLECRLLTGRTHQIRVHLAARGHPLLGDGLYGSARPGRLGRLPAAAQAAVGSFPRQALHARTLGFRHPRDGRSLSFTSDLPPDLKGLIAVLESI